MKDKLINFDPMTALVTSGGECNWEKWKKIKIQLKFQQ
jgi:hypothetical protein